MLGLIVLGFLGSLYLVIVEDEDDGRTVFNLLTGPLCGVIMV